MTDEKHQLLSDKLLEGASLRRAFFDTTTNIRRIILGNDKLGFIKLAGLHWGDVDLSMIDWTQIKILGDEREAMSTPTTRR